MYHTYLDLWKEHLHAGLKEDGWPWDWTSFGSIGKKRKSSQLRARVIAKGEGVWAADGLVHSLSQLTPRIQVNSTISDGEPFSAGSELLRMQGDSMEILAFERPFLNLAAYVSGIATATFRLVAKVKKACPHQTPRVCLTRKTLPGYRDIAIHGVRIGGGYPHRVNLSGGVLIKENHIAVAGSIAAAVTGARAAAPHGLKVEIEVRSMSELNEALKCGVEGVLLDNFSPKQVQAAVKSLRRLTQRPFVEVSGGVNESNVAAYAMEGVDVLSAGSLTHSVTAVDLSLLVI